MKKQTVLLVGAGKGGTTLLKMLNETKTIQIVSVVDKNPSADGMQLAKSLGIMTFVDWKPVLSDQIDIVIDVTGDDEVFKGLLKYRSEKTVIIPGSVAYLMSQLIDEKEILISRLVEESKKQETILNSTNDGMIFINNDEEITYFNKVAQEITGIDKLSALGHSIKDIFPYSKLYRVLQTKRTEFNQKQQLQNGALIVETRIPIIDEKGHLHGALAVFKDITEVVHLAEELTDIKEIQTMLEAIIQSSDEAISVVDEKGRGLIVNRAYMKMTGLKEQEVIGKPANADISEGESVHMTVLRTRKPVRGVPLKVGPNKKDVLVNVAPIIVDGKIRGSVGVIHDVSEIRALTNELNRARQIIRKLEAKYTFDDIVGSSEQIKLSVEQAKLGAKTPVTILLRGESGTGKELFAHAIHNESDRKYNKFIRVNCGAISESLLESELFGYVDGAFSGAKRGGKKGYFEEANNGSIFLDEVGELSPSMQVKLLRVLQEQEIVRVGDTKPISINVRVIAATNVNLEKAMSNGRFREDLYYRLNRYPIFIPSLRNRKEDIEALSLHLLRKISQDYGRIILDIAENAVSYLCKYNWPGNVRELENILGRAVIFLNHHESVINLSHIPPLPIESRLDFPEKEMIHSMFGKDNKRNLSQMLTDMERLVIKHKLKENGYNRKDTAEDLGISIRNLYYKLEKYQIEDDCMQ
ncbi:sigma 54-interacting transcriptional regulator [Bacillus carboniphilus]|uniref:Sigma 54-interacting transcriptional regulator n=1 Tax=Bacillus carboniphilus TaxID=86663 RepID=A0ABY9JYL5_9BACI|nr:sigma-54-dependent Fis family transcriptional regulator [Bacillus carboniphilus]WLR43874.1 sigma 54-interacting transcriptional regulator [Bacillus carboniphilus]